jgi:thymidine phosphorylase
MQKIIDTQGPPTCCTDLGDLTFDVTASRDGFVSRIDCLQLNRLARIAGAPVDKGAGIRLFKKIDDRVQQGEPLYRIHAYERSGHDLAAASTKINTAYTIGSEKTNLKAMP